jgi:23S rRNA (cytosine1962-C5)-methyltransferase
VQRWKLSRKAAQRIEAGQVWVYRGEFQQELTPETLEEALLVDERGRLLGSALVDGSSPVPLRLYSRREQSFDGAFLQQRIEAAVAWRKLVVGKGNTGYRLVFGESDGLPGLIVDRFGDSIAIQVNLRNYVKVIAEIVSGLIASLGGLSESAVIVVEENGVRRLVSGVAENAIAFYRLNDLLFEADLLGGPKTGAFLDQRENYLATAQWAERLGLEGRALDLFSSSGGFALHVAPRMNSVDAVDSSQSAISRIQKNAAHNGIGNVRAIESDVKQFLRGLGQARRRYECVIADPPAFAKQTRQKEEATRAYYDLNLRALSAVAPSGLFVSCSCSKVISEQNLTTILREVCQESRKSLTLLEKRGQAIDHREILEIPESSYLKCLLFRVSSL